MEKKTTRIELGNGYYKIIIYWSNRRIDKKDVMYFNSNNVLHRLDGPARISFYPNGTIYYNTYCISGVFYDTKEDWENSPELIKLRNIEINLKLLNKV